MKFTKEEVLEKIKNKLSENGKKISISDRTLNAQIETLISIGANDETELDDFLTKITPSFENLEGNYRKDNADFVRTWEESHKDKQIPPTQPTPPTPPIENELERRLRDLEEKEAKRAHELLINEKRNSLKNKMKEVGIKDDDWTNDFLTTISITDDMDIEASADKYLKLYNKAMAYSPNIPTPNGGSNRGGIDDEHLFDDIASSIKKNREEQNN